MIHKDIMIIRGTIVSAAVMGELEVTRGGYLVAENGAVAGIFPSLPECYAGESAPVYDFGDDLIVQAPVDMHLHAPQYPMLGTGMDLPLLDWLNAYAFPAEARFMDTDYARVIYRQLARELIENGTTRVCMFSSLHTDATLILMEELERAGVVGYVGKVNMDRNGGENLRETTEESISETLRWLDAYGGFQHVKPILTPRFTPSCTDTLMAFLGGVSRDRGLPVQSHLSENRSEIAWVQELHPDCERYWETYAKFHLWNERTVMAHCVHSDESERAAIRAAGVTVVHCPDSNLNICSGIAPIRKMLDEGLRVTLGSDIAGGDQINMLGVIASAIRASKTRRILDNWKTDFLTVPEAWYLGTSAGAAYFGDAPGFAVGNPLHALALSDCDTPDTAAMSVTDRLSRCLSQRRSYTVRAVWSAGRRVK